MFSSGSIYLDKLRRGTRYGPPADSTVSVGNAISIFVLYILYCIVNRPNRMCYHGRAQVSRRSRRARIFDGLSSHIMVNNREIFSTR